MSVQIIQTFFVSAVSGALLSELSNILDNPSSIVELLAKSLPGQSTYFVQILLVKTFLGLGLELLKVTPLVVAGIRSIVGPGLTEKERNSIWMGLRPLAAPAEFAYSDITSSAILYYMVLFGKHCLLANAFAFSSISYICHHSIFLNSSNYKLVYVLLLCNPVKWL